MKLQIHLCLYLGLISASFAVGIRTANADTASRWEGFVDFYGGYSSTVDDTVDARKITTNFVTVSHESGSRSISYDASFTGGARVGTYFRYIGGALDMSYFEADNPNFENSIFSISGLLMLRAQFLATDKVPQGQLQPYLAVGPSFFVISSDVDFRPEVTSSFELLDSHFGIDARAGLRWLLSQHVGLFAEYRMTHFDLDSENNTVTINGQPTERVSTTMSTHHVLGGLTFSF